MTSDLAVVVATNMPSPYQAALFDHLAATSLPRLEAIYAARTLDGRAWAPRPLAHPHLVIAEDGEAAAERAADAADLVIVSGYTHAAFRRFMRRRRLARQPFVFWGEMPGFRSMGVFGRLRRRVRLADLHRSSAPIWGIGTRAVERYAEEFGCDRLLLDVPYASDLGRHLAIDRTVEAGGPVRFLYSGQFIARKGVDLLARAFVYLAREGVSARLTLVGSGPLEAELRKTLAPVADWVEWRGFVQPDHLAEIYASADVLVAPSRHDGWGLIVPEGMAAAIPVISTDATGAAIDLLSPECGWVVPAGEYEPLRDAMREAAARPPNERHAMGAVARARAVGEHVEAGALRFLNAVLRSLDDRQRMPG